MMLKRNDGYTLAYVVVVLGVMATVALATMTLALMPQKNQHIAQERTKDKYAAQGLVEQVVAQLEHATSESSINSIVTAYSSEDSNPRCTAETQGDTTVYTVEAKSGTQQVIAKFRLEKREEPVPTTENSTESPSVSPTPTPTPTPTPILKGHSAVYVFYETTVLPTPTPSSSVSPNTEVVP